ncbi:MAG: potassium transporter TrkG, partial [Bradymonadaceae bacterium]
MISLRRLSNVLGLFGTILKWFGLVFLLPISFALWHGTPLLPFAIPLLLCLALGFLLERRFPDIELEMADGFVLVVLSWIGISLIGAIPYVVSGIDTVANPMNAIFESVSGFTCTGSTVMGEISLDTHSHAIMIWRQLTQWLGGMGILVLAVA